MPIDDRTANRSYQLPNAGNQLTDDVVRLRAALNSIDADIFARYTKTEVDTLINGLINGAPAALNTLQELAAALGNDANYAATVTTALSNRYTKTEADTLLALKANSADVTSSLALKANSADVYTKTQSDGRYLQSVPDGSITRAKVAESMVRLGSVQNTVGNSVYDWTNIPSWARRVTLMLYGVSSSGSLDLHVQLGVGTSPLTSGYINGISILSWPSGIVTTSSFFGIPLYNNSPGYTWTGHVVMEKLEAAVNNWLVTAQLLSSTGTIASVTSSGIAPLTGDLGIVRLSGQGNNLDAGYVNISWE